MAYQRQGQRSTQNYLQRKKKKNGKTKTRVVDNFELIVGLGIGMPLFIFFPL
jgi:hypothetical protein